MKDKEFTAKLGEAEQSREARLEKLEIVLSASAFWRGGRKGGLGGIPPAEPVNEIGSDIFKYTPPVFTDRSKSGFFLKKPLS